MVEWLDYCRTHPVKLILAISGAIVGTAAFTAWFAAVTLFGY